MKALHQQKAKLTKTFRETKDSYGQTKSSLQSDIQSYQVAVQNGSDALIMTPLLQRIDDMKQVLIQVFLYIDTNIYRHNPIHARVIAVLL